MEPTSLPMRYFAVSSASGHSLDEGMRCSLAAGHASRLSCLIPRCSATRKMRGLSRLRRNPYVPATLVGFDPFAVLFLQRRFRSVSARLSPHAVNELPPRLFFRGTGRLIPLTFLSGWRHDSPRAAATRSPTANRRAGLKPAPTTKRSADHGSSPRLLGIHLPCSPHLRLYQLGGAILPWD